MSCIRKVWKVVGGSAHGGITVRVGQDIASSQITERLLTGSFVRELGRAAGRLHYELLSGVGPATGWVSVSVRGKDLLVEVCPDEWLEDHDRHVDAVQLWDADGDYLEFFRLDSGGIVEYCNGELVVPCLQQLIVDPETGSCDDGDGSFIVLAAERSRKLDMLESLCRAAGVSWTVRPTMCEGKQHPMVDAHVDECWSECHTQVPESSCEEIDSIGDWAGIDKDIFDTMQALDGGGVRFCQHCRLPLGGNLREGGCSDVESEAEVCYTVITCHCDGAERELCTKRRLRMEYGIGWNVGMIPSNVIPAQKLSCSAEVGAICCLILQPNNDNCPASVSVASSKDPAAAVNLEYLSLALQVRRKNNRAPLFSLDLANPCSNTSMQVKRFEPDWLACTSAGEVLFQADVFLKELSMGEHGQPVVGMKSCLDLAEEEGHEASWSARVWFVVRDAEVKLSTDGVLVPHVELGVEAREQCLGRSGIMEDVPVTRPDHPVVRYAEQFTNNMAIIAERKSVIYHLRELAKATCLAKFLLGSEVALDEAWFHLNAESTAPVSLEVPQLWKLDARLESEGLGDQPGGFVVKHISGGVDLSMERARPPRVSRSCCTASSSCHAAVDGSIHFKARRFALNSHRSLISMRTTALAQIGRHAVHVGHLACP